MFNFTAKLNKVVAFGLMSSVAVSLLLPVNATAKTEGDEILGQWLTGKKDSKVEIFKTGDTYSGKISWLKEPNRDGKPKVDDKNPDKSKANRPIMGLVMLRDFKYKNDRWEDGKIYDPREGKEYSCHMTLKDKNTLEVRGYIGISLLGRSDIWTRK